jgi:ectoine hydroxylase-related dioxygenase (phytanoyl-CoA dioxygenase family)
MLLFVTLAPIGSLNQPFHGDGPHLFGASLQLPTHALNVFIPLDDITDAMGPTEFFPASHLLQNAAELDKTLTLFNRMTVRGMIIILLTERRYDCFRIIFFIHNRH